MMQNQTVTTVWQPRIKLPSRVYGSKYQQYCIINNIFSWFAYYYDQSGRSFILQILGSGATNTVLIPKPFSNVAGMPPFFIADNTIVFIDSQHQLIRKLDLAFDIFTGEIISAKFNEPSNGFFSWCLGSINRGFDVFPAFIGRTDTVYGQTWSSGSTSGPNGTGQSRIIRFNQPNDPLNFNSKNNSIKYLSDKKMITMGNSIDYQNSPNGMFPLNNGLLGMTSGKYNIGPWKITIYSLRKTESRNAQDCDFNRLDYVLDKIYDISLPYSYWGPYCMMAIGNYISVFGGSNTINPVNKMYICGYGNILKTVTINNSDARDPKFMSPSGYIYGLTLQSSAPTDEVNFSISNNPVTMDFDFDFVKPPFEMSIPISGSDIRTQYRSK